jgi:S1-C subfamily serine protease
MTDCMGKQNRWHRLPLLLLLGFVALAASPASALAGGKLSEETLKALKDATVYIQVTLPNGQVAQGSGFLAMESGLVFTNAHVVGMLEPDSRRPQKIEVFVRPTQPNARTLPGEVLGVDGDTDLAVLRIPNKDLPQPVKPGTTKNLTETQEVIIFGYPFGKQLGKNITVSKSSVSSLPKTKEGNVIKVQVNGGMHPGNSGGPVTDAEGKLIGVAVSGLSNTQIHFAIPVDSVPTFLNGRLKNFKATLIYRDGETLKQPIQFSLVDPLGRVRKVSVEYWVGDPKLPKAGEPQPKKTTVELPYDKKGLAKGELVIAPPSDPKQVLWFGVAIVDAGGIVRRYPARSLPTIPLERKAAELALRPQPGVTRKLAVDSQSRLKFRKESGTEHSMGLELSAQLAISPDPAVKQADGLRLQVSYKSLKIKFLLDGAPADGPAFQRAQDNAPLLTAPIELSKDGSLKKVNVLVNKVPSDSKAVLLALTEQMIDCIDALSVPLPGKLVQPLETWKAKRLIWVGPPEVSVPAQAELQYTFMGSRNLKGRPEGTIDVQGTLAKHPKGKLDVTGTVTGEVVFDLETGLVTTASYTFAVDLELMMDGRPAQTTGTLAVQLKR